MFGVSKERLSLGITKKVHGYEIKKMPLGAYLNALERLKDLPEDFMRSCFPGKSFSNIIDELAVIDADGITELATAAFVAAPAYAVGLVAELTGIDEDTLLNDDNVGLDGFMDIVDAFIEVNRLGEFIGKAGALKEKLGRALKPTLTIGSNG